MLWRAAIEKQKRNEFHDLETYVRLVTRLQPNFETPWIFQSWNLAYNVSVENERLNDMYFYISRGIELLAEGERQNNRRVELPSGGKVFVGSPDMRFQTAFYYQNKFGVADKVNTLRALMQVSCIPPPERDPGRFRNAPNEPVNAKEFEEFCRKNPQLVRRLREKLDCRRPDQVVDFLEENTKIPSRFVGATGDPAAPELQFPILPPQFDLGPDEYHAGTSTIDDRFDAFLAARAWYSYAQTVIPPNPTDASGQPIPTGAIRLTGDDRFRFRIPRSPALILFRQYPARAQSYLAERLTKEGWYDADTIWKPDEFRDPSSYWFKRGDLDEELALKPTDSSRVQWEKAFQMWESHGQRNAMLLSVSRLNSLQKLAERVPTDASVLQWSDEYVAAMESYRVEEVHARQALIAFAQNRHVTNFGFFHSSALAESQKLTVDARKLFGDAVQQETQGDYNRALAIYVNAMNVWRQVLVEYPEFHGTERSQEETYETLMKMSDLAAKELERPDGRKRLEAMYANVAGAFGGIYPAAGKVDLDRAFAEDEVNIRISERDRRVQERVAEVMGGIDAAASPLVASADASVRSSPIRASLARQIVEREYPWLKTRMAKDAIDKAWVGPGMVESVRGRLGLVRRLPPAEGTSPFETGASPQAIPGRMPAPALDR